MPDFSLIPLDLPEGARRRLLLLEVDGKVPYAVFEKEMSKSGKRKEMQKISVLFDEIAMGRDVPPNAIKPIKGRLSNDNWEEFELRKNQVRVYFFVIPPDGNIIVLGEFKKNDKQQRKTIGYFQELKQQFKEFYPLMKIEEE